MPEGLHYDSLLHSWCVAAGHQHPSCQVNLISEAVEKKNVKQEGTESHEDTIAGVNILFMRKPLEVHPEKMTIINTDL